jgi:multiple sugar transport system substrate-binding protein
VIDDIRLRDLARKLRSGRINRRKFLQGATTLGASAAAVSSALRAAPSRAQEAREVLMWCDWVAPGFDNLKAVVDSYNAQASDHQVTLEQIPNASVSDTTQLMTAVRGGTGPDIYSLDRFIVAQRAADGLLQDLSGLGAGDVIGNYIGFAQAEATYNEAVYALPFDTDARALFYNRSMIQDAGTDPAELDAANGPVTWDRIAEIAATLNVEDSDGNYIQMGFVPWMNQGWHYTYGFSWGGNFFSPEACEVTPDDPPIVEAFQWVQDYCVGLDAAKVNAFGGASMQPGFNNAEHPFHLGTLAMQITGNWEIGQMAQYAPDTDYGITWMPVPAADGESVTWAGGWSMVIPEGAKNADDAWTALQWIAGEQGQRIYVEAQQALPTYEALLSDTELFPENFGFFAEALPTAKNRPPLPVGARYWDELTIAWQKTYLGESDPADALATAKENVNADLGRYCPIS